MLEAVLIGSPGPVLAAPDGGVARPALPGRYRVWALVEIILGVRPAAPDLDLWLPDPAIKVSHRRRSSASAEELWQAAADLRLADTRLLGRLVRWRIPGTPTDTSFQELFSDPPFTVLAQAERALVSGLVGRIWTLRRDYPEIDPEGFRRWDRPGTAKVVFAHWAAPIDGGSATLYSETRVKSFGAQGRLGLASVRPLVRAFEYLIGSEALAAAARRAERR